MPLVYADVSPNNVFISETAEASEVWLIDLDNLDYLSANAPGIRRPRRSVMPRTSAPTSVALRRISSGGSGRTAGRDGLGGVQ